MTPGNRLYLYQLLSTKIGIGRQVPLSQVEELLDKDGIDIMGLGYEGVREFVEELDDFMRLTVFKKGRVYATVTAHEAFDAILARLNESAATSGKDAGEGAATTTGKPTGAKTWKHRKSNKDPKPAKPRVRIRREARRKSDPDPEAVVEAASGAIGGDAEEPTPSPGPEPGPEPQVEPEPEPEVDDRRAQGHISTEGHISISITYNPYDYGELYLEDEGFVTESVEAQSEQGRTGGADPVSFATEDSAHAAKDPPPAAPTGGAATRQRYELFQSFSHDVWCKDEPLSLLYQVLPYDIEPMSVLEDDWRYARSTGTYEGTHSSIRFPLSFRASGSERPIVAQLHRSVKLHAGKAWALEAIDLGTSVMRRSRRRHSPSSDPTSVPTAPPSWNATLPSSSSSAPGRVIWASLPTSPPRSAGALETRLASPRAVLPRQAAKFRPSSRSYASISRSPYTGSARRDSCWSRATGSWRPSTRDCSAQGPRPSLTCCSQMKVTSAGDTRASARSAPESWVHSSRTASTSLLRRQAISHPLTR